jgi:hypothetical protein
VDVVASWTGRRADALRHALRMTNESFAGHLGVAVRTVAYWRQRPDVIPRPSMQEILDVALARAGDSGHAQFALLIGEREHAQPSSLTGAASATATDMRSLTAWVTATNTSNEAIEHIDRAAVALADRHTQVPAGQLLGDVLELHGNAHALLHSGRQRLRQTRDLIRIDGDLLAHASVLMGDLGQEVTPTRMPALPCCIWRKPTPARQQRATPWPNPPGGGTTTPPPPTWPSGVTNPGR